MVPIQIVNPFLNQLFVTLFFEFRILTVKDWPKSATNKDNSLAVCVSVVEDVYSAVRKIAQQVGIGKSSAHEVSKENISILTR